MSFASVAGSQFVSFISKYGEPVSVVRYSSSFTAGSYDESVLAVAGSSLGSIFSLPVDVKSSQEQQFLEQGLIQVTDKKIFYASGLNITPEADLVFDAGSWKVLGPPGVHKFEVQGAEVYRRAFVRTLAP